MYTFVTSFSEEGYNTYAKEMLESVASKWNPKHFKLYAYYHDFDIKKVDHPVSSSIVYIHLNDVKEMLDYREKMKKHDGTEGGKMPYNWRLDAIKWCHKVYALTDCAFKMMEEKRNPEEPHWLIWIDADTIATKRLEVSAMEKWLPEQASIVHLGRKDVDYSETSFMGFNLQYHDACSILADLRGCYTIGETISYREWHDGFIFERLLNIYKAHGMVVNNLSENAKGLSAFMQSPLSEYFIHYKGNLKNKKGELAQDIKLPRYRQLADIIRHYKPKSITEVGTWNGGRAIEMALAVFEYRDKFSYFGFDLFEEATAVTDDIEMNSKQHHTLELVKNRLEQFKEKMKEKGKEFTFKLHKGDSKITLKKCKSASKVDLAFIDGGHSYETVKSDYLNLKKVPLLVFDDFFSKDEHGNEPEERNMGVNKLVKEIEAYGKIVLPSNDRVLGGGRTHLAFIANKKAIEPLPDHITRMPIVVTPKDSRPKDEIFVNIKKNKKLIKDFNWLKHGRIHNQTALIVSGGSSTDFNLLKEKARNTDAKIFCVKHSYPKLLEHGINPFICSILDPRPIDGMSTHGVIRKDLFKKINKDTLFLVASMTDPSVTKYLIKKGANIKGWSAYSEALRDTTIKDKLQIAKGTGIEEGETLVSGGTCAAMRTISIAHILGFRNFELFGFDCSVPEVTKEMQKERVLDKPKYFKVETNGEYFWTTGELLAMAQDCEKLFDNKDMDMALTVHGSNTLVSEVWKKSHKANEKYYYEIIQDAA
jgi:predicted O-methyltransferase YrrM